jgi:adenylylsulfate kinase-like enzyme
MSSDTRALLLTGIYGTGKSSVAEEIAELLRGAEGLSESDYHYR